METWLPPMDVTETKEHIIITLDVEDATEIQVRIDDGKLIVYGDTPRDFQRSICLIDPIDVQGIESYVAEQSIEVRVPKSLRLVA